MPNLHVETIGGDDDNPFAFRIPDGFEDYFQSATLLCQRCGALVPKDVRWARVHTQHHEGSAR